MYSVELVWCLVTSDILFIFCYGTIVHTPHRDNSFSVVVFLFFEFTQQPSSHTYIFAALISWCSSFFIEPSMNRLMNGPS